VSFAVDRPGERGRGPRQAVQRPADDADPGQGVEGRRRPHLAHVAIDADGERVADPGGHEGQERGGVEGLGQRPADVEPDPRAERLAVLVEEGPLDDPGAVLVTRRDQAQGRPERLPGGDRLDVDRPELVEDVVAQAGQAGRGDDRALAGRGPVVQPLGQAEAGHVPIEALGRHDRHEGERQVGGRVRQERHATPLVARKIEIDQRQTRLAKPERADEEVPRQLGREETVRPRPGAVGEPVEDRHEAPPAGSVTT
jgi:hypothetical protein